jgi:hypothetical protein
MSHLERVRHGARAALTLGVVVSIVANVLHADGNLISQSIAAWAPLALLITIELIARVPVKGWLSVARLVATATIAGIAAWVSYWHMVGVALRYGEEPGAAHLIPLTVDGLVVVAWVCLVEIGGRIREQQSAPEPGPVDATPAPPAPVLLAPVFDHQLPIGPMPAPSVADNVSDSRPVVRKPPPSSRDKVVAAHNRTPRASNEELAARLKVSLKTVERYRPAKVSDNLTDSEPVKASKVNGRTPEFAEGVKG